MAKTILVAGDATRWVHLSGSDKPAGHSPGGIQILCDLIGQWCSSQFTVIGPEASPSLPAEYFEWKRFERDWRVARHAGSDQDQNGFVPLRKSPSVIADMLVILDRGLGFAERQKFWPTAMTTKGSGSPL